MIACIFSYQIAHFFGIDDVLSLFLWGVPPLLPAKAPKNSLLNGVPFVVSAQKLALGKRCFALISNSDRLILPVHRAAGNKSGIQIAAIDKQDKVHLTHVTVGKDFGQTLEIVSSISRGDQPIQPPEKETTAMYNFKGKVALVTGASSGIGRETALAFAENGAKVVAAARREAEGHALVKAIKEKGGEAIFVRADVARDGDIKALIEKTAAAFGRLDFAFNNAGVEQIPGPLGEQTEAEFDRVMNVNVKGVWLSMKHQIPLMLKTGGGSIVNTSSVAGLIGMGGLSIYVASKHAVIGLTKSTALEFGKQGIRVNAIAPAAIETDMYERFVGDNAQFRAQMSTLHPIGRIGTAREVAEAALWLSSSDSSFVTGHTLLVDGGFTAQ